MPFLSAGAPLLEAGAPLLSAGAPFLEAGAPFLEAGAPFLEAGAAFLKAGAAFLEAGAAFLEAGAAFLKAGAPFLSADMGLLSAAGGLLTLRRGPAASRRGPAALRRRPAALRRGPAGVSDTSYMVELPECGANAGAAGFGLLRCFAALGAGRPPDTGSGFSHRPAHRRAAKELPQSKGLRRERRGHRSPGECFRLPDCRIRMMRRERAGENIQHSTSNIQHPTSNEALRSGVRTLDVPPSPHPLTRAARPASPRSTSARGCRWAGRGGCRCLRRCSGGR